MNMSDHNKASEPAFPIPDRQWPAGDNGMSLRDYFAAKALEGQLSARPDFSSSNDIEIVKRLAARSYIVADMMLIERDK